MIKWLTENWGTLLVLALVIALVTSLIVHLVREHKKGNPLCGEKCSTCDESCPLAHYMKIAKEKKMTENKK